MKKNYFLLLVLSFSLSFGQLSENFDAAATLPAGWTTFRGDNGLGTGFDWTTSTARSYSPTRSAFVRYEDVTGGIAEDWLITPLINLTNYTASTLTFYGGQQYTPEYNCVYDIRVSTTLPTGTANFTVVEGFTESDFTPITLAPLQPSDLKTIDLSAYDGQQIYIAFVMTQDDGDNFFVDDVNVTGTLQTTSFDGDTKVSVFPNPTSESLNITSNKTFENIALFDVLGKEVKSFGNKTTDLNISELNTGVYILKLTTPEGVVASHRVIKN